MGGEHIQLLSLQSLVTKLYSRSLEDAGRGKNIFKRNVLKSQTQTGNEAEPGDDEEKMTKFSKSITKLRGKGE